MGAPFFTIGHSTRPTDEFVALLKAVEVRVVVDVRTVPRSRANPQFNRDSLPASLAGHQIAYEHLPALGGLRGRQRDVSPNVNAFWENASFHNFADRISSDDAVSIGRSPPVRIMAGRSFRLIMCWKARAIPLSPLSSGCT